MSNSFFYVIYLTLRQLQFREKLTSMQALLVLCSKCSKYHTNNFNCGEFICKTCFEPHAMKDLVKGICPQLYRRIARKRQETALPCVQCQGFGSFSKISRVSYYQGHPKVDASDSQDPPKPDTQPPQRVLKAFERRSEDRCSTCRGRGRVNQYDPCCLMGCPACLFTGLTLNPLWDSCRTPEPKPSQVS